VEENRGLDSEKRPSSGRGDDSLTFSSIKGGDIVS